VSRVLEVVVIPTHCTVLERLGNDYLAILAEHMRILNEE
jgi:hypothetical protein